MPAPRPTTIPASKQLLHLCSGRVKSLADVSRQRDECKCRHRPSYAEAYKAWKAAAQRTVDNAQMRYFIVHIHRLLDPGQSPPPRS